MTVYQTSAKIPHKLVIAIVLSSAFLFTFNQFLLITAYPTIMEEFSINATQVQWLTTAFLLTTAIFIPMTGYLADTYTTRTLVNLSLIFLVLGTIIALIAPNFLVLILSRVVQAVGAGIMIPLVQTILLAVFPYERRGFAMGLIGLVVNVAPASAPAISGIIIDAFNWYALFWLMLPLSLLIFVLSWFYMKNVTEQRASQFDLLSMLLSAIGFAGVIFGLSNISVIGFTHWSVVSTIVIGLLALVFFIKRQLALKVPTLNLRVFKKSMFTLSTLLVFIIAMLLLSAETILPLFSQDVLQTSAFISGMVLLPGTVILSVMSLVAGNLFDKYGGKAIALLGFSFLLLSTVLFSTMGMTISPVVIALYFCIFMLGLGTTMMPLVTLGINSLEKAEIAHGVAIANTVRQFALAFGVIVLTTVISLTTSFSELPYQEATFQGIRNSFIVMSALSLTGLLLSFFLKENRKEH